MANYFSIKVRCNIAAGSGYAWAKGTNGKIYKAYFSGTDYKTSGPYWEVGDKLTVEANAVAGYECRTKSITVKYADQPFSILYVESSTPPTPTYYQYKVTYNDNGGSGGPGVDYTAKKTSPTITYTISSTKPTRTGYTFKGWDLDGNGTADYQPGGSIAVARNITLTAVWEAKSYSIKFEQKEGETYSANLNTSKTYGTNYQLPSGGYVSKAGVVNGTYSVICVPANGDNNTILTYTNNTRYVQNG